MHEKDETTRGGEQGQLMAIPSALHVGKGPATRTSHVWADMILHAAASVQSLRRPMLSYMTQRWLLLSQCLGLVPRNCTNFVTRVVEVQ